MRILIALAALTIIVMPVQAKDSRDDEWQPIRLPGKTEVQVLTSRSASKMADMARFYKAAKESRSDCRIKMQGQQLIVCINPRGNMVFEVRYDSVRETLTVTEATINITKGGRSTYAEDELVTMMKEFFN
nr:hypothetical protein [Methylobacterium sp. ZNC0032]